jgi:hypothetical protein
VFHLPIDGKIKQIAITKTFVEATGGEYFLSPSIGERLDGAHQQAGTFRRSRLGLTPS